MIEGIPITSLSAPAILGLAVILIFLGKIVPRSYYLEKKEESDRWREAYEAEREARSVADSQSRELLELAKTTHSLITAVFANSEQVKRESGDSNVASNS